ncbi:molybdopterin-dependent oxidoreductase [Nocardioides sp.]|uniref:molybdopterin-dependent oxidoreductase n=1 Tax=Nocardioides sp. TaxID=35761 RepID=UPI0035165201
MATSTSSTTSAPHRRPAISRRFAALAGLLAAVFGMAVGHLVASLLNPDSSPVLAVGSTVIDSTPASMKEWAIRTFESDGFSIGPIDFPAQNYDKVVLVGSVLIGVLVAAGLAGLLVRRSFRLATGALLALVALSGAAVLTRPTVEALDVVPVLFTAAAGVAALWTLTRTAQGLPLDPRAVSTAERAKAEASRAEGADDAAGVRPTRRGVLIATGALTAAAALFGGAGRWINSIRARAEDIALPTPASPAPAFPTGLEDTYPAITPLRMPNNTFYRVDTRLDTPVLSSADWKLTVDGMVDNPFEITFEELLDMPMIERDITLTCVSNSVGGKYVGGARWLGVPLKDILDRAGVQSGVDQIFTTDFDGMTISTPYDIATDGRDSMLAVGMNGVPLPREHGFPVRQIIPGLYGFISATKWITRMTLTTYADKDSYWTQKKWATDAPIKPSTRIDTPRSLSTAPGSEPVLIGGVAWAQFDEGVSKVQVQIDGGPWIDADLGPDVNSVYWRQWYYLWQDATPGSHLIRARTITVDGLTQTDARVEPFPAGSSGIHSVSFTVG